MKVDSTEKVLNSMLEILEHIKDVQSSVIELSKESMVDVSSFLNEKKITPDTRVLNAIQYQDIISQQLNATIEAINSIDKNINFYLRALREDSTIISDGFEKLQSKLNKSLKEAKNKKDAFSGKTLDNSNENEEIEFF